MSNKVPSEVFCLAPWTHTYISPQSERRICCASREEHSFIHQYIDGSNTNHNKAEYAPDTLENFWNSEHVRNIRLKMLRGEAPPECVVCNEKILSLSPYRDYFTKELFPHLVDEAIKSTDETGRTSLKPRSFDYRFTNKCNFKCRMCGDQLSSSWEQEKRKHNTWTPESHPWMTVEIDKKIKHFQKETVEKEFLDAILKNEVEEIYWVGGEPLAWDLHWQVMQFLVDSDKAKNIYIRYNTNLSIIQWKGRDLLTDLLPHFKGYAIYASIDAIGSIGEYIRTGLDWNKWKQNLDHAIIHSKEKTDAKVLLDITLTLPGLFGLKELVDFAKSRDLALEPKIVYAFDPSIAISPLALPRELLNEVVDYLIKHIFPITDKNNYRVLSTLIDLKKRATHAEAYPDKWKESLQQGKDYLRYLEKIRDDKFGMDQVLAGYPKILQWWQQDVV